MQPHSKAASGVKIAADVAMVRVNLRFDPNVPREAAHDPKPHLLAPLDLGHVRLKNRVVEFHDAVEVRPSANKI